MKTKYSIIIIILLILTIILAKVTKLPDKYFADPEEEKYQFHYKNRHITAIIPESQREKYRKVVEYEEKLLNIKFLTETKDSLAIRFWYMPALVSAKYLLELKCNNNTWDGKLYIIKTNHDDKKDIKIIENSVTPKSGWNEVIEKINHYGVFVLPDFESLNISSNHQVDDGADYWVEVLNEKYYRFYTYNNPYEYEEIYECYYFYKIAHLLELEFGIIDEVYL